MIENRSPNSAQTAKPTEKLERRTFHGFKRENMYDYIKSNSIPIIHFKLSPVGIGRIENLRVKLEHIVGSLFEDDSNEIHPCFDFMIRKLMYYQTLNSEKKTEYRQLLIGELSSDVNNRFQEEIIKGKVSDIAAQWLEQLNQKAYCFAKEETRMNKLIKYDNKVKEFKDILRKELKTRNTLKKQKAKTLTANELFLLSDQYIQDTIRNVDSIELLRISQQSAKYNNFQKKNKQYFDVSLNRDRVQGKPYVHIKINRPSQEIQPILQNIYDLIRLRDKQINYRHQSSILYKNIYENMKRYESNSTESGRSQYHFLHPSNVIFDQISLAPRLSFLPVINELLGISHKPMSIEDRIIFSPTPKQFDYFRSIDELDPEIQLMLNDPFFGNLSIYDGERHRLKEEEIKRIDEDREFLQGKKENIITFRFLLLCYYLLESKQFGFVPNLVSYKAKEQTFAQQLMQAKEMLSKDMSQLSQFLGVTNQQTESKPFKFFMCEINSFLEIENVDSVIQTNKYVMVRKYFQARNLIIKEFIRLLVNDTVFGRVFNIKKYIFLYFSIAIEILEESKRFNKAERGQAGERKKLRIYLEKELKRMKNDKNHFGYLQTTYEKIEIYRTRDSAKDHQAKFAKEQEIGKKSLSYVQQTSKALKEVQHLNQILNQLESKQEMNAKEKVEFDKCLTQIDVLIKENSQKLKCIINQFIFSQLRLKHRDGPHKCAEDANKNVKQFFSMYTTRLELLTLTYISICQDNFITYDSLILPQFRIDDADRRIEVPREFNFLKGEVNSLKIVSDLIESSKLLPKKMIYLSNRTINDELRLFQQKSKKQSQEWNLPSLVLSKEERIDGRRCNGQDTS